MNMNAKPEAAALEMSSTHCDSHEVDDRYFKGSRLFIVMSGLWMGTMLVAIDNTILGTAVPRISTQFNAIEDVGWYGSAYLLTVTATQPSFGKVFKYFDPKWVYLMSIILFEAGSALCAAAPNSNAFITGRAIAGLGAAGLFQGALTIVGFSVELGKRPLYLGVVVSAFGIALAFGPPLGGALTDKLTWRWCFWLNLPIGGAVFALIAFFLKLNGTETFERRLKIQQKLRRLDVLGGTLVFGAITCLLLAIQWGGTTFAWNSSQIIGLFVGFGLLLSIFVFVQWRLGDEATIPYRVLSQRSVLMGSLFICSSQGTSMVLAYYLPFYFQATQNVSAMESGLRYLPLVIPQILAIVFSGAIATKTGHYVPYMVIGQSIATIGLGLLTRIAPGTKTVEWASYLVVTGLGIGTGVQLPYTALQVVLSDSDLPTGNAIMTLFSQLGGTLSVGIAQSIFISSLIKYVSETTAEVSPAAILAAGATELENLHLSSAGLGAAKSAFSIAVRNTVILALVLSCIAVPVATLMEWKNVKKVATERMHSQTTAGQKET